MNQPLVFLFIFLSVSTSGFAQLYKKGYYYTQDGQRVEGQFRHSYKAHWGTGPDNTFSFKATKNAPKKILTTKGVKALVIEKDSFTVIKNIRLSESTAYDEDFVQVVKAGKINLYKHFSDSESADTGTLDQTFSYLAEKDGKVTLLKRKEFKSQMAKLIADDPDLLKKIQNRELKYDHVEKVVDAYNQRFEQEKSR
jgi:tRNA A58 N-methylase Trm61